MKQIFTAKSIDEAKELAAAEFGVAIGKIRFNILEEPRKSLFGKIKGEAKVEAEYELTKADVSVNYILKVLKALGITNVKAQVNEIENGAEIELIGDDMQSFIGKKGEALDSLQYLSSLVCNKIDREYYRISIDCEGFRARRKIQLEELAKKIATNVKKNGRTSALEPMNPYERRIVHGAVSEIEGVSSRSVGEDPYRKVLISSTEKKPYNRDKRESRGPRNNNRGGTGGGRKNSNKTPKPFDITTSFEKDYKKPKPEDSMTGTGLYSKIEF
ncbi:MAG: KH domain-containing protein [Clostridiales bacterium]|nr:KH domain-containing protein [Clostridiales bacterium]